MVRISSHRVTAGTFRFRREPVFSMVEMKKQPEAEKKLPVLTVIRKIKIPYRLIGLFMLLSLLPIITLGFFSYQESSRAIQNKIETYAVQLVAQLARNLESEMNKLEYNTIEIGFSDLVQDTLERYTYLSEWEIFSREHDLHNMIVKKYILLHDVSDVLLYTNDNRKIVAYGDRNFELRLKDDYLNKFLQDIRNENGKPLWRGMDEQDEIILVERAALLHKRDKHGILVGRAIRSLYEGENIGVVIIRLNERFFSGLFRGIDIGPGAEVFIIDGQGVVVSTRSETIPFKKEYKERSLIEQIKANTDRENVVFNLDIDGIPHLVAAARVDCAGWYVVSTIPYSYLNLETQRIKRQIMLLGGVCFGLAVALSFLFTKSISIPLNNLIKAMNSVKNGRLSLTAVDNSRDEIGEVTRNFNAMVQDLKRLLADVKEKELQKRKAEIKVLQAQINPHFLSNILNTAKTMASMQGVKNLESLLTSLIKLLHASMGKDEEFITVRKEVEYIENYLNIQEFRYYNKFHVEVEIEEEILENKLPKFLLQPVVENAIIHGIAPKKGQGFIEIKGFLYEEKMIFVVTDDGVGMTEETIRRVLHDDPAEREQFCGMGLKNVRERIRIYFGDEYGVRIESRPHHFTRVEITLPVIK